jgi:hypothetical protein
MTYKVQIDDEVRDATPEEVAIIALAQSIKIMAKLCAAGVQLREQIDDDYPDRDRKSDGWIADARHLAKEHF